MDLTVFVNLSIKLVDRNGSQVSYDSVNTLGIPGPDRLGLKCYLALSNAYIVMQRDGFYVEILALVTFCFGAT